MLSSRHAVMLHWSSQQLWLHKPYTRWADTPARGTNWTQWVGQKCQKARTWRWDGDLLEVLEEGEQNLQRDVIKTHCQRRNKRQSLKEACKCDDKKSCQYKDDQESHLENRGLRGRIRDNRQAGDIRVRSDCTQQKLIKSDSIMICPSFPLTERKKKAPSWVTRGIRALSFFCHLANGFSIQHSGWLLKLHPLLWMQPTERSEAGRSLQSSGSFWMTLLTYASLARLETESFFLGSMMTRLKHQAIFPKKGIVSIQADLW